MDKNTRIIDLTLGELLAVIDERMQSQSAASAEPQKWLYGLKELASFLGCSESKACIMHRKGMFDGAKLEVGRSLMFNRDKIIKKLQDEKG